MKAIPEVRTYLKASYLNVMSRSKKGIYYREGNHRFTHCYWMINSLENDERTIRVYFLSFSESDKQSINDYEVYDSEDYRQIEEQLRMLRLKYPKVIKVV